MGARSQEMVWGWLRGRLELVVAGIGSTTWLGRKLAHLLAATENNITADPNERQGWDLKRQWGAVLPNSAQGPCLLQLLWQEASTPQLAAQRGMTT